MNELKDLVPPLEMCKQIPRGAFNDSALVWITDSCGENPIAEPRRYAPYDRIECPAPTLAEILEASDRTIGLARSQNPASKSIGKEWVADAWDRSVWFARNANTPAAAALMLWLAIGRKEKKND